MSKFPDPIDLPYNVYYARYLRSREVVKFAKIGISFRISIILFELIGAFYTQSSALFVDAMASLTDVASTFLLIIFIKLAQRPPDENHPFGHGRYEPLGGLLLGILLTVLGGVMVFQQLFGFTQEKAYTTIHPLAWVFSFIPVILLEICYRIVMNTAKKEKSPALAADAYHYRIDSVTSLIATVALLAAAYFTPYSLIIDNLGALFIAFFMIGVGIFAAKDNFHQLMDKTPENTFFKTVRSAAEGVQGVRGTEKIRIQSYGPDAHVDIDVEVDPLLTVDIAHKISQEVRVEIQKAWPAVRDVTVHIEPYYANDH